MGGRLSWALAPLPRLPRSRSLSARLRTTYPTDFVPIHLSHEPDEPFDRESAAGGLNKALFVFSWASVEVKINRCEHSERPVGIRQIIQQYADRLRSRALGGATFVRGATQSARIHVRSALKGLRRVFRQLFGRGLARLIGPRMNFAELPPGDISSVLVCRINGRLGNTVLLTPLVRRIHELLPHASIDLALAYPQASELLERLPGVRRVITFPHGGRRLVRRYFGALRRLRGEQYDLVIDPVPESTSGRVALTLSRARYRVGFATDSQWAPLTHAVPEPDEPMHQAIQPVFLLCRAFGAPFDPRDLRLSLCLPTAELAAGQTAVAQAVGHVMGDQSLAAHTFGFFAHATAAKTIERGWWLAFWEAFLELQPDAVPVEFLPTPHSTPTDARFPSLHCPSTRALTAAISATRMFISADTGPMHLASATPVPTVALFRASDATFFRPLKPADLAIDIRQFTPRLIAERCQRVWRESIRAPNH